MNEIEHAGWYVVGYIVAIGLGAFLHWIFRKNDCTECGISELKSEISRLCLLVYALAEKAGMSLKEQLEIQNLEPKK